MEVRKRPPALTLEGKIPTPSGGQCNELTRPPVRRPLHRCASIWDSSHYLKVSMVPVSHLEARDSDGVTRRQITENQEV